MAIENDGSQPQVTTTTTDYSAGALGRLAEWTPPMRGSVVTINRQRMRSPLLLRPSLAGRSSCIAFLVRWCVSDNSVPHRSWSAS